MWIRRDRNLASKEGGGVQVRRIILKRMSLKRLQALIAEQGPDIYPEVIAALQDDPREGAQRLVRQCQTYLKERERQRAVLQRMYSYERQLWSMGYRHVAGLDEVGRGPLAGPVVAAAVILPGEVELPGIEEAKRLSGRRRMELYKRIREVAVAVGVGLVQPEGLDEASVVVATYKAFMKAVNDLPVTPDYLLIDGVHLPGVTQPQVPVVGGDTLSCSIAAAAVVAKVVRDEYMVEMDAKYPAYGFAQHKGYGTAEHRLALERYGPCPIHRKPSDGTPAGAALLFTEG